MTNKTYSQHRYVFGEFRRRVVFFPFVAQRCNGMTTSLMITRLVIDLDLVHSSSIALAYNHWHLEASSPWHYMIKTHIMGPRQEIVPHLIFGAGP